MSHAEHTITIERPPAEVFSYLADGIHNREWRSGVVEIERTADAEGEDALGEGAVYRQILEGPGGRRVHGDYRVTAFDPPRRLEFQVIAGGARPTGVFELAENPDKTTRLRFALDLDPMGPMKLMAPMIVRQMRHEVGQLDNLKTILEA